MIKIAIIEDEAPARKKLTSYIKKIGIPYTIVTEIETIEDTLAFLNTDIDVDLIFSDIELRDGNVFDIYSNLTITTPIIFATAYNQFWMNAFETNGIEYLLKPYSFERFEKAWKKYTLLKDGIQHDQQETFKKLVGFFQNKLEETPVYKEFIPIKSSKDIYFLKVADIVYIQADYGVLFAFDHNNKKHMLNQNSLKEIQKILDPAIFFKLNRSELVNKNYIDRVHRYNKNTLAISIKNQNVVLKTSQNTTAAFNHWMGI